MVAEITLFKAFGPSGPALWRPFDYKGTTFTTTESCIMRVFANGSNVSLQWGALTSPLTVPNGSIESFGLDANVEVTVA